jgi:hypothetical protein
MFKLLLTTAEGALTWALNYVVSNCDIHLDTSSTPIGSKIGGHDNVKVPDKFIIITFYFRGKVLYEGYWEVS